MFNFPSTFLTVSVLMCVGCGSDNPWEPVAVSGKVTYEDGSLVPGGMRLYFIPQTPPLDQKTFPRQGGANVGPDGNFGVVTTYKYGDGLIPGVHKVLVTSGARGGQGRPAVPPEYGSVDTTPVEINTADSPVHIKIRKP
jgi:hypothetical protein